MSSPAQLQANRANASRSTGPRSPEGKAASARNALQHGLRSRHVVLKGIESIDEFEQLRESFYRQFGPAGPAETSLVDRIAAAEWRLRRIGRIESATVYDRLLDAGVEKVLDDPGRAEDPESDEVESQMLHEAYRAAMYQLQQLYRFEAQLERSIERSIAQLERLRKSSVLCADNPLPPEPPAEAVSAASASNSNERSQSPVAVAGPQPLPPPHGLTVVPPRPSGQPGLPAKAAGANR